MNAARRLRLPVAAALAGVCLVAAAGCTSTAAPGRQGAGGAGAPPPPVPACPLFCADHDGDGWGGGRTISAKCEPDGALPPPGFALCAADCDDQNPAAWYWAGPDGDGDGYRPPGAAEQCVGVTLPAGFRPSTFPNDCDDHDAARNPGRSEQYSDGVDSNCDGRADPHDCAAEPAACGCADLLLPSPVAIDAACGARPDPFVAKLFTCGARCGVGELFVVIGNRGGAPLAGSIAVHTLNFGRDEVRFTLDSALGSGQASKPINLTADFGQVVVTLDPGGADDCDPSNDTGQAAVSISDCF
jgi:hypothetical protein